MGNITLTAVTAALRQLTLSEGSTPADSPRPPAIFSPAAYFAALRKIRSDHLAGSGDHPFDQRRPDVAELEPMAPRIDEPVPYIEIINGLLERQLGAKDPYPGLASAKYPFSLPFHRPLSEAWACLDEAPLAPEALLRALAPQPAPDLEAAALLRLPPAARDHITEPSGANLAAFWGLRSGKPAEALAALVLLLPRSGLDRDGLLDLLFQELSPQERERDNGVAQRFFINRLPPPAAAGWLTIEKEAAGERLKWQPAAGGRATEIDDGHLDHMHRFLRLAGRLGWSFADLDYALTSSCGGLNPAALPRLSAIEGLRRQLNAPVDLLCSLWSDMKSHGLGDGPTFQYRSLLDRTFNNGVARDFGSFISPPGEAWRAALYPGLEAYEKGPESWLPRLSASLRVSKEEAALIDRRVAAHYPGPDLHSLSLPHLSRLHRFAALARLLRIEVAALFELLDLLAKETALATDDPFPPLPGSERGAGLDPYLALDGYHAAEGIALVGRLVEVVRWLAAERLQPADLAYIAGGDPGRGIEPPLSQERLKALLAELAQRFQGVLVTASALEGEGLSHEAAERAVAFLRRRGAIDGAGLVTAMGREPRSVPLRFSDERMPLPGPVALPDFDGSGHVNCGSVELGGGDFTIEFWARMEPGRAQNLLGQGSTTKNKGLHVYCQDGRDGGQLRFCFYDNDVSFPLPKNDGGWHHFALACTKRAEGKVTRKAWFDGKGLAGTPSTPTDPYSGTGDLRLGGLPWGASMTGRLAEVAIWRGVRSDEQVKSSFAMGVVIEREKLIGFWPLWRLARPAQRQAEILYEALAGGFECAVPLVRELARALEEGRALPGRVGDEEDQKVVSRVVGPLLAGSDKPPGLIGPMRRLLFAITRVGLATGQARAVLAQPECCAIAGFASLPPSRLKRLTELQALAGAHDRPEAPLMAAFTAPSPVEPLAAATGWPRAQIEQLFARFGIDRALAGGKPFTVAMLAQVAAAFAVAERLGASPEALINRVWEPLWGSSAGYQEAKGVAGVLLGLVRGRAQAGGAGEVDGRWQRTALRRRRDALLARVLYELEGKKGVPAIDSPRALYHYLLIDVEMGEEAEISRLEEAIACLQLYLNRCRLHQEGGVRPKEGFEAEWASARSYRTWEARMRVQLYPENYLSSAVRPERSAEFKALEEALQQRDGADAAAVEEALRGYLTAVAAKCELELVGSTVRSEEGGSRQLLLVGRAPSGSGYFLRTARLRPDSTAVEWRPWEALKLQVEADRLYPVHAFGKLFMFWVDTRQSAQEPAGGAVYFSRSGADGGWLPPRELVRYRHGGIREEDRGRLFVLFDQENQQLYCAAGRQGPVRGGTSPDNHDLFRYGFQMKADLAPQTMGELAIPTWWMEQPAPQVGGKQVVVGVPPPRAVVGGEPDWLLFGDGATAWLARPDNQLPPLSEARPQRKEVFFNAARALVQLRGAETTDTGWLDGGNDVIKPKASFTIEMWVLVTGTRERTYLVSQGHEEQGAGLHLCFEKGGTGFGIRFGFWTDDVMTQEVLPADGQWHHVAVTYDASSGVRKIFWDLGSKPLRSEGSRRGYLGSGPFRICGKPEGPSDHLHHQFPGMLAELRVWDHLRTENELAAWRDQRLCGSETGLVRYWPLDDEGDPDAFAELVTGRPARRRGDWGFALASPSTARQIKAFCLDCNQSAAYRSTYPENGPRFDLIRLSSGTLRTLEARLEAGGVDALFAPPVQQGLEAPLFLATDNPPRGAVGYTPERVRSAPANAPLDLAGAVGDHYWELFFHAPLLLADRLNGTGEYEAAQRWYERVYNPRDKSNPWQFLGLRGPRRIAPDGHGTIEKAQWQEIARPFSGSAGQFSLHFTGGARVRCPDINLRAQDFTIELWARRTGAGGSRYALLGQGKSVHNEGLHLCLDQENATYKLIFDLFRNRVERPAEETLNQWQHYAFVMRKEGSDYRKSIFVRGRLHAFDEGKMATPYRGSGELRIGWSPTDHGFEGQIAEVRIWDRALSEKELREAAFAPLHGTEPGLRYYWPLDEGSWSDTAFNYAAATCPQPLQHPLRDDDPFDPHAVARRRPSAYRKWVAMRFIGNLIDHGDACFRRFTQESLTEATLFYVTAYDLLMRWEGTQAASPPVPPLSASQMLIALENLVPASPVGDPRVLAAPLIGKGFLIPENSHFLALWELVQERLYKVRHRLDIDGRRRVLPAYGPLLDPARLPRGDAGSGGGAGGGALADVPHYRFAFMLAKARELAARTAQLGAALLAALEKRDAEALGLLRTTQERSIAELTRAIKAAQLEESAASLEALAAGLAGARARLAHYTGLIDQGLSALEVTEVALLSTAQAATQVANASRLGASIAHAVPDFYIKVGSPFTAGVITQVAGGSKVGRVLEGVAAVSSGVADALSFGAHMVTLFNGYQRRAEEWNLQKSVAEQDVVQIEHQIEAARLARQMVQAEQRLLEQNIAHDRAVEAFLTGKFTSRELYQWQAGRLLALYRSSFQMAFDLAAAAERAFQYEMASELRFLSAGHFDGARQGLLAAEALEAELDRMEKAHLERNARRFEIEKSLSLSELDPHALLTLRTTGRCEFHLSEALFDRDFPGHYARQIRRVTVSFPALIGPYQNLYATLTQLIHRTLTRPDPAGLTWLLKPEGTAPASVRHNWRPNQQVALSRGLNDAGLFEFGFQDERYLPFEGTGAVSSWHLEVNGDLIDLNRLSDVILRIEYTALPGGEGFRALVTGALANHTGPRLRLIDLAAELPEVWQQLSRPGEGPRTAQFQASAGLLRVGEQARLKKLFLALVPLAGEAPAGQEVTVGLTVGGASPEQMKLKGGCLVQASRGDIQPFQGVRWQLTLEAPLPADKFRSLALLLLCEGPTPPRPLPCTGPRAATREEPA